MKKPNNTQENQKHLYSTRDSGEDTAWIRLFQFLPDRVIQLYCFVFKKDQIGKGLSFILFLLTYLVLIGGFLFMTLS
jgi:hypothetical protein